MKTGLLSVLCLALLMLTACEPSRKDLYDDVMKVHDEAMPKMDDIYKIKRELQGKLETTPTMGDAEKKAIDGKILNLEKASQGMMEWMHHFNPPDSASDDEAKTYLKAEMEKIKKVKEEMVSALEEAGK